MPVWPECKAELMKKHIFFLYNWKIRMQELKQKKAKAFIFAFFRLKRRK